MMYRREQENTSYRCRQYCILDHWIIDELNRRDQDESDPKPLEISDIVQTPEVDYDPGNQQGRDDEVPRGVIIIDGDEKPSKDDRPSGTLVGDFIQMRYI